MSLLPPPWLELTTSEPRTSATRVRPPGSTRDPVGPAQDVRPQIDVAALERAGLAVLVGHEGRVPRERDHRLGDVVARVRDDPAAEVLDLAPRRRAGPISIP